MKANSWISLRADLKKKLEQSHNQLAEGVQQRREVQEYLGQVSQALNLLLSDVKKQEEDNNLHLAELISLLEEDGNQRESRVMESLFNELSGKDSLGVLKEKLNSKFHELYQEKLSAAATKSAKVRKQKNVKTIVRQLDGSNNPIPCCKPLEEGFIVRWDQAMTVTKRDLILLSYTTCATNERTSKRDRTGVHSLPVNSPNSSTSSNNLLDLSLFSSPHSRSVASPPPMDRKFIMQIFEFKKSIGQLNIRPESYSSCNEFINLLSAYCSSFYLVYDKYRFKV
jgi:hypothetical protein